VLLFEPATYHVDIEDEDELPCSVTDVGLDEESGPPHVGRTLVKEVSMSEVPMRAEAKCKRSERLEVRTTPEDRALIDSAVAASKTDLTEFVVANLTVAARRVLADRSQFVLDSESQQAWENINRRRARDLPGLRELMERASPFVDE
jgi:uncharacterized protein (DUF1778 family)